MSSSERGRRRRAVDRTHRQQLVLQVGPGVARVGQAVCGDARLELVAGRLGQVGNLDVGVLGHAEELDGAEFGVDTAEDRHLGAVAADEVLGLRPVVEDCAAAEEHRQHQDRNDDPADPAAPSGLGRRVARAGRGHPGGSLGRAVGVRVGRGRCIDERSGDDRQIVAVAGLDDVGDDDGDVVGGAATQRQFDEPVSRVLRIAFGKGRGDGVGRDDVAEPVGTQQVAVSRAGLPDRDVGVDVGAGQGPKDHRLAGVVGGLLERQPAGVDERLDVGVVVGDLGQRATAQQVRPRVADVDQPDLDAGEAQRGERGAHPV